MRAHKLKPAVKAHRTMHFNRLLHALRSLHGALIAKTQDYAELEAQYGVDVAMAIIDAKVVIGQAERYE